MKWRGNMGSPDTRRLRALVAVILIAGTSACTRQETMDALGRTLEGTARGACAKAGNCQNTCPDGSIAQAPLYSCP